GDLGIADAPGAHRIAAVSDLVRRPRLARLRPKARRGLRKSPARQGKQGRSARDPGQQPLQGDSQRRCRWRPGVRGDPVLPRLAQCDAVASGSTTMSSPSSPTPIGRLAPSPTGAQHVGNARTYLIAWLSTRTRGGRILLRIEDIDSPRVKAGAADSAVED